MPEFICHLFVCCNRREPGHARGCCDPEGAGALKAALKEALKARKLGPTVRVNEAGCLDQCEYGPTVVVYPRQIWYGCVTLADVERIVDETVVAGRILSDLQIPAECLNTKGRVPWRRPDRPADGTANPV